MNITLNFFKLYFWKFIFNIFLLNCDDNSLSDISHSFMTDVEKAGKVGT